MRLAMIGAGNVGSALGRAWLRAGEDVVFGIPDPSDPKYQALPRERLFKPEAAARNAEIVVLATPWPATEAAVKGLGDLSGKIVIDCTNPLGMGSDGLGLVLGYETSGGEQVASWASGASVFKSFNQTGAENMDKASRFPVRPVMFVAGDDAAAKPTVLALVSKIGFEAVDAGPLRIARLLEPYGMLWIDQVLKRGRGADFAFALARRGA
ncbi:MAG TPA: NADPH-dependent F420 reductase [Stellaceae bacterium]|jgi:predicted dinucleotide-binding enzyme|nr:NADPH-dependent F420 reductase [Stellaceae bacterium]